MAKQKYKDQEIRTPGFDRSLFGHRLIHSRYRSTFKVKTTFFNKSKIYKLIQTYGQDKCRKLYKNRQRRSYQYFTRNNTIVPEFFSWWYRTIGLARARERFLKFVNIKRRRKDRRKLSAYLLKYTRKNRRQLFPYRFKYLPINLKRDKKKRKLLYQIKHHKKLKIKYKALELIRLKYKKFQPKLPKEKYQHIYSGFLPLFSLLVKQTVNNIFMTALSTKKNVVTNFSAGTAALYGPRRSTTFASEQIGRIAGYNLNRISFGKSLLCLRSPLTRHVSNLVRAVAKHYKKIKGICDKIPRSHNGLRPAKKRRL